jgi:NTP pyrophosphatase (non-canonical NTP hydrolase)
MDFNEYQKIAKGTADYPVLGKSFVYPALGLAGEAGEVAEKIKKIMRNNDGEVSEEAKLELTKELGDVLWYIAQISTELGVSLDDVVKTNIEKLKSRKERGVIRSQGDNR